MGRADSLFIFMRGNGTDSQYIAIMRGNGKDSQSIPIHKRKWKGQSFYS